MAQRLYRCYNTKCTPEGAAKPGFDFAADTAAPKCPKCGIALKDPKFGRFIVTLVTMHFDPPSGIVHGVGKNAPACTGVAGKGHRMTGHPGAVNCPACMATEDFKAAVEESEVHPDHDFPVETDLAKAVIRQSVQAPAPTETGGCR